MVILDADGTPMAEVGSLKSVVLNARLAQQDGLNLREDGDAVPVLILSALGEVDHRVEGLRAGGDDYLAKPYSFTELLARVEAIGRRSDPSAAVTKLKVGDLEMDLLARTVRRSGQKVLLQPREFRLLECLMRNAGRVVTRTMLLEKVWDYHFDPQTNVIDVHISRLRGKIDKDEIRSSDYLCWAHFCLWFRWLWPWDMFISRRLRQSLTGSIDL